MRITIDTEKDKKEEIRKVIDFLNRLISGHDALNPEPLPPETSQGMMSMFDAEQSGAGEAEDLKMDKSSGTTPDEDTGLSKQERVEIY